MTAPSSSALFKLASLLSERMNQAARAAVPLFCAGVVVAACSGRAAKPLSDPALPARASAPSLASAPAPSPASTPLLPLASASSAPAPAPPTLLAKLVTPPSFDLAAAPPELLYEQFVAGHQETKSDIVAVYSKRVVCYTSTRPITPIGLHFFPRTATVEHPEAAVALDFVKATWQERLRDKPLYVHGHAFPDEAKTPDEAVRLSKDRAEALARALVARGVPRSALELRPHGYDHSAVLNGNVDASRLGAEVGSSESPPTSAELRALDTPNDAVIQRIREQRAALVDAPPALSVSLHAPRCCLTLAPGERRCVEPRAWDGQDSAGERLCAYFAFLAHNQACSGPLAEPPRPPDSSP